MSLKVGFLAAAVAAIALGTVTGGAAARPSHPTAHIATACSVGSGEGYGYTYLTSLNVTGTTCATGKTLVRHKGRVSGWRCAKKVLDRSPVQYDARETCTSGLRRVVYNFTQNT